MKIVLGLALIVALGFGGLIVVTSRQRAAALATDPLVTSIAGCQGYVRAELKAPATAVFVDGAYAVRVAQDSPTIRVVGHVDAQNGFGALVRNDYGCLVQAVEEGRWLLVAPVMLSAR